MTGTVLEHGIGFAFGYGMVSHIRVQVRRMGRQAIPCRTARYNATLYHVWTHHPNCAYWTVRSMPHTVLYRSVPYRTVLYRTAPHRTVPHHTALYHTMLYPMVLYLAVL